jgi:citrate lyase subunit beta/citryl-CoA lyase
MKLRTMLFVPANKKRWVEKVAMLGADAIILDMEDSVPFSEKETSRTIVQEAVKANCGVGVNMFVRVNDLTTGLTTEDLKYAIQPGLTGIVLPKAESVSKVLEAVTLIDEIERERLMQPGKIVLMPLLESAIGVLNAREIATSSHRIVAIGFGALDFTRDMGISLSPNGTELHYARSYIALVARVAEIQAIDSPWINITDLDGLIEDANKARQLGFNGKFVIHLSQIEPVNYLFAPAETDVADAEKIVTAFEQAQGLGLAAISLDGRMIDTANYRRAKDLLKLARELMAPK